MSIRCLFGLSTSCSSWSSVPGYWELLSVGALSWPDDESAELTVSEANLRHLLFARNGLPERLLLKLQEVTGLEIVSKEQIENTYRSWISHLYH